MESPYWNSHFTPSMITRPDVIHPSFAKNYALASSARRSLPNLGNAQRRRSSVHPKIIIQDDAKNSSCCGDVKDRMQEFSEETVIQGLGQMFSSDLPWMTRLAWGIVFMAALFTCTFFVGKSVDRYISFNVSTTMELANEEEVNFPAITFCNENMLRKSKVEYSPHVVASFTALMFGEVDEYDVQDKETLKNCTKPRPAFIERPLEEYEILKTADDVYQHFKKMGVNRAMRTIALDSYQSVLECWIKDEKENCSNIFLNHITDYGLCFTYNPGENLMQSLQLGMDPWHSAYGIPNSYGHKQFILKSTGPSIGFKALLHVHQDEYCVTRSHSAGFNVLVHDADVQPLFFLERPLQLSPGYETNIAIRYTKFTRNTKDLDRCVDDVHLDLYPNATKYYKEACYMQCFTNYVYSHCGCTPLYGPPKSNYLTQQLLNLTETPNMCWNQLYIKCLKSREHQFLQDGLKRLCDECKEPCEDTHYDFQVSMSYFPAENFKDKYIQKLTNLSGPAGVSKPIDMDYMRRNLISVNIYVESMQLHMITERQAVNLEEFVGDCGAHIGFMLGLSIISLFEFFNCCLPRNTGKKKPKRIIGPRFH